MKTNIAECDENNTNGIKREIVEIQYTEECNEEAAKMYRKISQNVRCNAEHARRCKHNTKQLIQQWDKPHGQPLSNNDIREEVDTFMFEGHDTTTSGISFTCYLLSRHPTIQQKVFEEIRAVIDGKLYPGNTNVTVMIYHALRDPAYFKDPEQFIPERFYSDNIEKINSFAYVPFSAGPRNCAGQKCALLEMKSTISKILRHFELLPFGEDVRPLINLVLVSSNGINMGLQTRLYIPLVTYI